MKVYTWNIPEIYHFPIYDRYIPGIFHKYDTIQIPDVSGWGRRSRPANAADFDFQPVQIGFSRSAFPHWPSSSAFPHRLSDLSFLVGHLRPALSSWLSESESLIGLFTRRPLGGRHRARRCFGPGSRIRDPSRAPDSSCHCRLWIRVRLGDGWIMMDHHGMERYHGGMEASQDPLMSGAGCPARHGSASQCFKIEFRVSKLQTMTG